MFWYTIYSVSVNSFSVGINWNYWRNDHDDYIEPINGHEELTPWYLNLKNEIMEYSHIDNIANVYSSEIWPKANAFSRTKLAKSITRANRFGPDLSIDIDDLICIIFTQITQNYQQISHQHFEQLTNMKLMNRLRKDIRNIIG